MNKVDKGQYGYMNSFLMLNGLITLAFAVIIGGLTILTFVIFKTIKTPMIVVPILCALPFAKYLAMYLSHCQFKGVTKSEQERLVKELPKQAFDQMLYDITITSQEKTYYVPLMVFCDDQMYIYMPKKYQQLGKTPSAPTIVKNVIKKRGYDYFTITFYSAFDEFMDVVHTCDFEKESEWDYDGLKKALLTYSV